MLSPFAAECIGTMLLIIFGSGVVGGVVLKDTKSHASGWVVITLGWGLGVTMAIYAVGKFSGAHINPAVTLGLAITGSFPWKQVPLYLVAQFTGAFLGAMVVYFHYLPHWKKTESAETKLAVFSTCPAIRSKYSNLVSEIIGTFVLMLGILTIGANEFTQGLNPLIVGLLVVVIGLSLGGTTGYAINPARDLGPRIAHFILPIFGKGDSDWNYAWIPVLGPIVGGAYGAVFYQFIFKGEMPVVFWVLSGGVGLALLLAFKNERK